MHTKTPGMTKRAVSRRRHDSALTHSPFAVLAKPGALLPFRLIWDAAGAVGTH